MKSKMCSKCKKTKELWYFYKDKTKKDGLCSYCKLCDKKKGKKNSIKNKEYYMENNICVSEITCSTCNKTLSVENFNKNSNRKNGMDNRCVLCKSLYVESVKMRNKNNITVDQKKCYKCKKMKSEKFFHRDSNAVGGLSNICKNCSKIVEKQKRPVRRKQAKMNYKKCPEKFLKYTRNRRATKRSVQENYTEDHAKITENAFENKCFKCGAKEDLCKDHNLPLSKGNALSLLNAVLLCRSCNSSKGSKDPEDFYNHDELRVLKEIFRSIEMEIL